MSTSAPILPVILAPSVILAKARIQEWAWIPACAGMTNLGTYDEIYGVTGDPPPNKFESATQTERRMALFLNQQDVDRFDDDADGVALFDAQVIERIDCHH